ncbi:MAG: hypothetical protein WC675_04605 [Patescibacteria group bacterium]|jgi:hypothetical protein
MAATRAPKKPETRPEALKFISELFAQVAHTEGAVTETTVWPCLGEDQDVQMVFALTRAGLLRPGDKNPITPDKTTVGQFLDRCNLPA